MNAKINGEAIFPAPFSFWNNTPRLIENGAELEHMEIDGRNPAVVMQLRYMAAELLTSAFSVYDDRVLTREEVEDDSYICGDCLNLGNGEGYQIGEHQYIDYLFAVELYGASRGCLALYDNDKDCYSYWLIY